MAKADVVAGPWRYWRGLQDLGAAEVWARLGAKPSPAVPSVC